MSIGRLLRHLFLFVLGAIWILPLYLFLINASTSTQEYAKKERWEAPTSIARRDRA